MKNSVKWIALALSLIVVIGGAAVLYNNLAEDYKGESLEQTEDNEKHSNKKRPIMNAPDFTVLDSEGNKVALSDYLGKPIVVNFWATWCHYCKEEMPDFNKAYKEYPDVQFVMVNATDGVGETIEKAKQYVEQNGYEFDIFFDTEYEAMMMYVVTGLPATFFIDKEGNIVTKANGMIDYETLQSGIKLITEN